MLIALDYDNTVTTDPELWKNFVVMALRRGHRVAIVTMRFPIESDDIDPWIKATLPILFTCRKAKKPWLEKQGIMPDIWIDDTPEWILTDSK